MAMRMMVQKANAGAFYSGENVGSGVLHTLQQQECGLLKLWFGNQHKNSRKNVADNPNGQSSYIIQGGKDAIDRILEVIA